MKRYLSMLLTLVFVLAFAVPVSAARPVIRYPVTFNGHPVHFDTTPEVLNGRTFVPFRAIFEKMGANVAYDSSSRTITATRDNTTIRLTIGSNTAMVNGQARTLSDAPYIKQDRTMVPLRFVGEAFGGVVNYDPATTKISIIDRNWPKRGGTLNLGLWNAPDGVFNPWVVSDWYGQRIVSAMYSGMWKYDNTFQPVPDLAESWEWDSTNTQLTFYLNRNARFFDGTPVTAHDVVFSFKGAMHPKYVGPATSGWEDVLGYPDYNAGKAGETAADFEKGLVSTKGLQGLYAADDYTVVFKLKQANVAFFTQQTGGGILDSKRYASIPVQDWGTAKDPNNVFPNGNGAFKMEQYQEGQYAILVANDGYLGGRPYVDRAIFHVVAPDVAVGMVQRGQLDWMQYDATSEASYLDMQKNGIVRLHEYPDLLYQIVEFNTKKGILADKNVRKAIAHAIDRDSIIANLMKNHASKLNTPLHPLTFAYTEDGVPIYDYNLTKSRQLLEAAGWRVGRDGIREKSGQRLKISLMFPNVGNQVRIRTAPVFQQMLKEVGIEVELLGYDWPTLLTKTFTEQDFDMFFIGWSFGGPEPDPTGLWDKASTVTDGNNPTGWWTERSEQLIRLGKTTSDIEKRMEYYAEFQRIFMEDVPMIPLYAANTLVAQSSRMQNFKPGPWSDLWNIEELWLSK